MRSWTIAAGLLLGLAAQAGMAVASDAAGQRRPQPETPAAGSAPASGAARSSNPSSTAHSRSDSPSRPNSASTSPSHSASGDAEPEADGADRADGADSADGRRAPRTERSSPAASPATAAPPPAVFIISCNASGCNDNQGRFLTRSGPQRLVGPNGLSCQLMGGNWQCSPGTPP